MGPCSSSSWDKRGRGEDRGACEPSGKEEKLPPAFALRRVKKGLRVEKEGRINVPHATRIIIGLLLQRREENKILRRRDSAKKEDREAGFFLLCKRKSPPPPRHFSQFVLHKKRRKTHLPIFSLLPLRWPKEVPLRQTGRLGLGQNWKGVSKTACKHTVFTIPQGIS